MTLRNVGKLETVRQALHYVDSTSDDLVGRVLAGETRFKAETEKLETDDEPLFYRRRDDLVRVLNNFPFNEQISDEEREMWSYELFKEDLKLNSNLVIKYGIGTLVSLISIIPFIHGIYNPDYRTLAYSGGALFIAGAAEVFSAILKLKKIKTFGSPSAPYTKLCWNSEKTDKFLCDNFFVGQKEI